MWYLAAVFLLLASVFGVMGFGSGMGMWPAIAKGLFAVFSVLFFVMVMLGRRGNQPPPA